MMKNLKFWSLLMAFVCSLALGFVSCDDDDDNSNDNKKTDVVSGNINEEGLSNGQQFYRAYKDNEGASAKALALSAPTLQLINNRKDKTYTSSFVTGLAMEKYGVSDYKDVTEEQIKSVEGVVDLFTDGFQTSDLASILTDLSKYLD